MDTLSAIIYLLGIIFFSGLMLAMVIKEAFNIAICTNEYVDAAKTSLPNFVEFESQ